MRYKPMPVAPRARASPISAGNSMLAIRATCWPSPVSAGRSRSVARSASTAFCRRPYSLYSSSCSSVGSMMSRPRVPSMMTAVAAGDGRRGVAQTDDGGDAHRPRHDGRVAGSAADVRAEADDVPAVELGRLARQKVVGDDDHVLRQPRQTLLLVADQRPQHPPLDVVNVLDALGQIAVLHRLELPGELAQDLARGELGGHQLVVDGGDDLLFQRRVAEHSQVEVEDAADLACRACRPPRRPNRPSRGGRSSGRRGRARPRRRSSRPRRRGGARSTSSASSTTAVLIDTPGETPMPLMISMTGGAERGTSERGTNGMPVAPTPATGRRR